MAKLKQYITEAEYTDGVKDAYTKQSDGRYKLNDLSDDHSLVVAQTEVIGKRDGLQTQVDELIQKLGNTERERDEFKNKAVPSGFRSVKKEVAELGEAAQAEGFTKETITSANKELKDFREEKANSSVKELRTKAAKAAGVKNIDEFFNRKATDALNLVEEKEGDKDVFYNVTTDKDGKEVKTLFNKDYLLKNDGFKSGASSLFAGDGNNWVDQDNGDGDGVNEFDQTRNEMKKLQGDAKPRDNASVITALGGVAN